VFGWESDGGAGSTEARAGCFSIRSNASTAWCPTNCVVGDPDPIDADVAQMHPACSPLTPNVERMCSCNFTGTRSRGWKAVFASFYFLPTPAFVKQPLITCQNIAVLFVC
jgi:hypothetical protein